MEDVRPSAISSTAVRRQQSTSNGLNGVSHDAKDGFEGPPAESTQSSFSILALLKNILSTESSTAPSDDAPSTPLSQTESLSRRVSYGRSPSTGNVSDYGARRSKQTEGSGLFPGLSLNLSNLASFLPFRNSADANSESSATANYNDLDGSILLGEPFTPADAADTRDLSLEQLRQPLTAEDASSTASQRFSAKYSPFPSPSVERPRVSFSATRLSRRPSEAPTSPSFVRAQAASSLDPITLYTIAREEGEEDALRAVNQRSQRDRITSNEYSKQRAEVPIRTTSTLSAASFASTSSDTSPSSPVPKLSPSPEKRSLFRRMTLSKSRSRARSDLSNVSVQSSQSPESIRTASPLESRRLSTSSFGSNHSEPMQRKKIKTIKTKIKHRDARDFADLFLAQELCFESQSPVPTFKKQTSRDKADVDASSPPKGSTSSRTGIKYKKPAVWTLEMSLCGGFIAAAGHDGVVRIWRVIGFTGGVDDSGEPEVVTSSPTVMSSPDLSSPPKPPTSYDFPVFEDKPHREYHGHESDILDLCWSKNSFILSASMDKTVKLWHAARPECLCTFQHDDFVTSIAFHPRDDRYFISGSLDCKLRLWDIPAKALRAWTELEHLITAVLIPSHGRTAMCGTFTGHIFSFELETLNYLTSMQAKSTRGKNAKGRKITSLRCLNYSQARPRLLAASNDSRIRIFNVSDQTLEAKFSGHENASSQIRASFSEDGEFVICGSEDGEVYIWSSGYVDGEPRAHWLFEKTNKVAQESFSAESTITTCAIFAPESTKQLLFSGGDSLLRNSDQLLQPAFGSGARDAVIICADDKSGVIRVYRNTKLPEDKLARLRSNTFNQHTPSHLDRVRSASAM